MNWDSYFLKICDTVASNSKCHSRQIGAIIVRDKSIISTGYNGPPKGVPDCGIYNNMKCPRYLLGYKSGEGLELCVAVHGEVNAIINAAKVGVCTKDTIMYTSTGCNIPCKNCLGSIINAGITEIAVSELTYYDEMSEYLIKMSGLKVRQYQK